VDVNETPLAEVILIDPDVSDDERGHFFESFNARVFRRISALDVTFVQDNQSCSRRGVLRGLHYQLPPATQGKLVRVVAGSVFDVAVDLRRSSPTFGRWVGDELSADNRRQMWVPPGFGHGFLALSDDAEVLYKVTEYYAREHERAIRWNDPNIGIAWPLDRAAPLLSAKDATAPLLADAEVFA
jgi:dTDP-4-dehydrorhamnose 3,5-epimerase